MDDRVEIILCGSLEEWLAVRRTGVGSSDAPSVMGEPGAFSTPLKVYWSKRGLMETSPEESAFMRIGKHMEPSIAAIYAEETGRKLYDPGRWCIMRSVSEPWLMCTIDRMIMTRDGVRLAGRDKGVLEIKHAGHWAVEKWTDGCPRYVWIQIQHQLMVTGMSWGAVSCFMGGIVHKHADVARDESFISELRAACKDFWRRVQEGDEPPATAEDSSAMNKMVKESGGTVMLDADALEVDKMFTEGQMVMTRVTEQTSAAAAWLKQKMGSNTTAVLTNGVTYTWKTTAAGIRRFIRKEAKK